MKKTFSLICVILLCHSNLSAQVRKEVQVNQEFIFKTLHEIIQSLERRYDLEFDFSEDDVPDRLMRTQSFRQVPLDEVVETLLQDLDVEFIIRNHQYVIIRKVGEQLVSNEIRNRTDPTRFNFTLSGKVVDANSGESLPFSTILIVSEQIGAAANVDGNFTLFNVPSDTSTVLLQYLGYRARYIKLEPGMIDESNYIEFQMEPLVSLLEEVVVTDQKEHMIRASESISKVSVSPSQLAALPSLGEKDIFRSLQLLPGISATNETSSGLYVRGGTPDQNLVLFDGFTVYHVDHFYGFFSAFNANAIKNVQLYKGGFESKYGGRISSVVDMTGKNGNLNDFSGSFGFSALSVNASVETPFGNGKGSTFFSYRRSFTDVIRSGLYDSIFGLFQEDNSNNQPQGRGFGGRGFGQFEQEPSFYFYDLNGKITYRPSRKDVISLSFYSGEDNLDNSNDINSRQLSGFGGLGGDTGGNTFNNDRIDLNNWGNIGTSFKWGHQWNQNLYTNSVISYSNYFSDRDFYSTTDITRQDTSFTIRSGNIERNDISDITLRIDNEYILSPTNKLSFGTQITLNQVNYSQITNDTLTVIDTDDSGWVNAIYLQNEWSPSDDLTLNYGFRVNNYSITDKFYFEPRLSASYQINERLKAKAAWGLYNQFVTRVVKEDVSQGSQDFWLLADDDLNPSSSSQHFIAGLSYETNQFLFDVEGFYKSLNGLSEYTLRLTNNFRSRSVDLDELFFEGTGYSRGIETLVQKKYGNYTGWMSYTISEVIHDFSELSSSSFPALHDQTHEFKFVNSYRLGRWNFSGTWVFATGKPYTSPVGAYELTYLDGTTETYVNVGEKNAFRLADYHRLDVSAVFNLPLEELGNADVGFSIFNLYNRSNVWYKTFEIIEGDFITSDVNTIGITPNFFFTLNF